MVYAACNGIVTALLADIMPCEVRTTGFAFSHVVSVAIFGEFTPAVCTWLIHATGTAAMPGVWLSASAVLILAAALACGARTLGQPHLAVAVPGPSAAAG